MKKGIKNFILVSTCASLIGCTTLSPMDKQKLEELRSYGISETSIQKKSPPTAGVLNVLPGFGNFYLAYGTNESSQWLFGFLNLICWPLSVVWGIPEGVIDANTINKKETAYYYTFVAAGKQELEERKTNCAPIQENSTSPQVDTAQTKAEGTAFGAVAGALVGTGIGLLAGGKKNAMIGGLGGALAGAALGHAAGSEVANTKEQYASTEDKLNESIQKTVQYNKEMSDSNATTLNLINSLNQEIAAIKSNSSSREAQSVELETERKKFVPLIADNDNKISKMRSEQAALTNYLQSLAQTENHEEVNKLNQEIASLQTNIALLDQSNKQMAQIVDSLTVKE